MVFIRLTAFYWCIVIPTALVAYCRQYGHFDPVPRNFRVAGDTPRMTGDRSESGLKERSRVELPEPTARSVADSGASA